MARNVRFRIRGNSRRQLAAILVALLTLIGAPVGCSRPSEAYDSRYTPPPPIVVSIIGDSYTGGSPLGGYGESGWPTIAKARLLVDGLKVDELKVGAEGGAGYVQHGQRNGTFSDEVAKVVARDDDLVVIFGGINDRRIPAAQLSEAVRGTFQMVKRAAPTARLLVIGPAYVNPDHQNVLVVRDVLQHESEVANAIFVDPVAEDWFGAESRRLIGTDNTHPTNDGHVYLADKIAPYMAKALRS